MTAVFVVNPITASWSFGTTQPDTPIAATASASGALRVVK
jgi:hypothetical protein